MDDDELDRIINRTPSQWIPDFWKSQIELAKEISMEFNKAVKIKQWLRLAIDGISGSGKTFTALATADGMAAAMKGKIALIDSEHGSASLYADRFNFDTLNLMEFQIENYIEALNAAAEAGYEIVIIDSTSHAWDALVERVERIAHQRFNGNTFRAWAEGTPLQKKLIEAMLSYPGHVIVTCRSKTEYSVDKDEKGKTTVKKVGTAAVQRQGFEYEFTMAMTMDVNHVGAVTKDRTGKFQDKFIDKPGKKFGQELIAWLNEGSAPPPPAPQPKSVEQQYKEALLELGNILDSEDSNNFGRRVFSVSEKDAVRAEIKEELAKLTDPEKKLAYINGVIDEQKKILFKRLDGDSTETSTEPPPPKNTPPASAKETPSEKRIEPGYMTPPKKETPAASTAMQPSADDGFEDDIPWDDDKPGKGKKGGKPKSQSAETETADAAASEELALS